MGLFGKRSSVFKNKHVLVTGGTGACIAVTSQHPPMCAEGIGLETAKELVRRGALVSVCSRSSSKTEAAVAELQALAASIDGEGGRTRAFGKPADVTKATEVRTQSRLLRAGDITVIIAGGCHGCQCRKAVWPHRHAHQQRRHVQARCDQNVCQPRADQNA